MDHERIEVTSEEPIPNKERHMRQSLMIRFAWRLSEILVVNALPNRFKFTTVSCTSKIRQKIKNDPEQQGVNST
jgi:hypothetical protein